MTSTFELAYNAACSASEITALRFLRDALELDAAGFEEEAAKAYDTGVNLMSYKVSGLSRNRIAVIEAAGENSTRILKTTATTVTFLTRDDAVDCLELAAEMEEDRVESGLIDEIEHEGRRALAERAAMKTVESLRRIAKNPS